MLTRLHNIVSSSAAIAVLATSTISLLSLSTLAKAETTPGTTLWTFESSMKQAMSISPEVKQSIAEIGARQTDLQSSSMWPDPSVELRVDNSLGLEDGSDGYDLTEITISQAIPVSRLDHQQSAAEAKLNAARQAQQSQALEVQNRVAKIYYELQLASAQLSLAGQRVAFADKLMRSTKKNSAGHIVRYLTPLEKMRLNIIREKANQQEVNAEGKYYEALSEFYKVLGLAGDSQTKLTPLTPISEVPQLTSLNEQQKNHPQLKSQLEKLQAASNQINVARSSAMEDPTISLNRSRENFSSGEENVYGLMVNFQIPIHDRKDTAVSKAKYNVSQQRIELSRQKRELEINLQRSFTHLNHIIEQASDFEAKVLKPAKRVLDLSNKGFNSGELSVLEMVDANNTYFDSRMHYLDLIYQSWVELADVNLYAGKPMLPDQQLSYNDISNNMEEK